jgi:hypothetical protein
MGDRGQSVERSLIARDDGPPGGTRRGRNLKVVRPSRLSLASCVLDEQGVMPRYLEIKIDDLDPGRGP